MTSIPLLDVQALEIAASIRGNTRPILKGISFDMAARESLGIIGGSGGGKSVLAKALVGLVDPPLFVQAGTVMFSGVDMLHSSAAQLRPVRGRRISYVGADPTTIFDPTVAIGAQIAEKLRAVRPDIGRREALERVLELFHLVRIPEAAMRMNELPAKFSGGMIQRAAIVDAVIGDVELLIADNVTQPLDVTVAAQIIRLFQDLRERLNTAILFISSSLPVVKEIADRLIVVEEGEVIERSTPALLAAQPGTTASRRLVAQIPRLWSGTITPPAQHAGAPVVLSVTDVRRNYHVKRRGTFFGTVAVQAVRGVTFDVRRGESLGIVGESGCGKSTLLRLLTWLELPDTGDISFDGASLASMSARQKFDLRAQLQLVLQDPYGSIVSHWTIGRTISEGLRLHGSLLHAERRDRVLAIMQEVGLDPALYGELPSGLSAGQRQRINVARALVLEPRVLLLDETLSALDPGEQARLIELFETLQRTRGITCIFISHDLAMVRRVSACVAVMYLGRIVEYGTNEQLFRAPSHPYTRALLSAVPTLETSPYERDRYLVDGEPPSPVHLPPGCAFANRCPMAQAICHTEDPATRRGLGGSLAACHFASEDPAQGVRSTTHESGLRHVG